MRILIATEFMTLDGVVEAPGGEPTHPHAGWILVARSATLVRTLLAEGLVDELRLMVYPVLIGGGLAIFPQQQDKVTLELTDLVRYKSGVLLQVYRPVS
jgi:dihydrofolate reductase